MDVVETCREAAAAPRSRREGEHAAWVTTSIIILHYARKLPVMSLLIRLCRPEHLLLCFLKLICMKQKHQTDRCERNSASSSFQTGLLGNLRSGVKMRSRSDVSLWSFLNKHQKCFTRRKAANEDLNHRECERWMNSSHSSPIITSSFCTNRSTQEPQTHIKLGFLFLRVMTREITDGSVLQRRHVEHQRALFLFLCLQNVSLFCFLQASSQIWS